jgi:CBS domain-containing protein
MMNLTASSVMSTETFPVRTDTPINKVIGLLLDKRISGLPVVDAKNRVLGMITEHDVMRLLFTPDRKTVVVSDLWTKAATTVREDQPLFEVAQKLLLQRYRRVPVVDDEDRLVGIISRRDIVQAIRETRRKSAGETGRRKKSAATTR